jgi:hypothetical protein
VLSIVITVFSITGVFMKLRQVKICEDIAIVPLTKGYETVIDIVSIPLVEKYNWYFNSGYAATDVRKSDGSWQKILMHRLIINAPDGYDTDHVNCNKLDNRISNLRIATRMQNNCNQKLGSNNTSGYKGVYFDKRKSKWKSCISINGVIHHLGYFADKESAHSAYCAAAMNLYGEFARFA